MGSGNPTDAKRAALALVKARGCKCNASAHFVRDGLYFGVGVPQHAVYVEHERTCAYRRDTRPPNGSPLITGFFPEGSW